jgi:hypothetical protein
MRVESATRFKPAPQFQEILRVDACESALWPNCGDGKQPGREVTLVSVARQRLISRQEELGSQIICAGSIKSTELKIFVDRNRPTILYCVK